MKQKLLAILTLTAMLLLVFAGCENTATGSKDATDLKTVYASVLDGLSKGDAYAFVDLGGEQDALLVTDYTFDVDGELEAIAATVYVPDASGTVQEVGKVESDSTSMPLTTKDKGIYYGSHHWVAKATLKEDASKLVEERVEDTDADAYEALFNAYLDGTIIAFTK